MARRSFPPRKVYQAEHNADDNEKGNDMPGEELPTVPENDDEQFQDVENGETGDNHDHNIDDGNMEDNEEGLPAEDLRDIAHVLTVTTKRLQSTILGRKFSGKKLIEEQKRTSTCSACGQTGHWAGDAACQVSAKGGKAKGRGSASVGSATTYSQNSKKAFVVTYGDTTGADQPPVEPSSNVSKGVHFTFPTCCIDDQVSQSYVTECIDFAGFMVLDTACQRSCAGSIWMKTHEKILQRHSFGVYETNCNDQFQFGAGHVQTSSTRAFFPVSFAGQSTQGVVVGVNLLDLQIPFLASRTLLERLGCIIDMAEGVLYFSVLDVSIPLRKKHGHLVACITEFPAHTSNMTCWNALRRAVQHAPDPELLMSGVRSLSILSEQVRLRQLRCCATPSSHPYGWRIGARWSCG